MMGAENVDRTQRPVPNWISPLHKRVINKLEIFGAHPPLRSLSSVEENEVACSDGNIVSENVHEVRAVAIDGTFTQQNVAS